MTSWLRSLPVALEITEEREQDQSGVVLRLSGALDASSAALLLRTARRLLAKKGLGGSICLDFSAVTTADTVGAATIAEISALAADAQWTLRAEGLNEQLRSILASTPAPRQVDPQPHPHWLERLGERGQSYGDSLRALLQLLADTCFAALISPFRGRFPPPGSVSEQATRMGADAVPIACITVFLIGLSTAFQAAFQLRAFGANMYVANLVAVAMVYELGPIVTAIVVAGRTGSAIAAELGTMTVGEEIDALRTMGIDPIRYLVTPRLYALTLVQPALTVLAAGAGIMGGFLIALSYLDLSAEIYWTQTLSALSIRFVTIGLLKSICFAWVIVITGVHCGLRIRGGAVGVGRATTVAVVASIFAIIFVDTIITTLDTTLNS